MCVHVTDTTVNTLDLLLCKCSCCFTKILYFYRAVLRDGNAICLHPNSTCVRTLIDNIPSRPFIPKDYASANNLRGMKFMYSVEFEKLLYLSFMEPQV